MSERNIVGRISKQLGALGFLVIKIHGSAYQLAGLPDLLAIRGGRAYWFEVKQPGEYPTKLQDYWLKKLRRFGCVAGAVTSEEDVLRQLQRQERRDADSDTEVE
jgi:Holliday junction resolvase